MQIYEYFCTNLCVFDTKKCDFIFLYSNSCIYGEYFVLLQRNRRIMLQKFGTFKK